MSRTFPALVLAGILLIFAPLLFTQETTIPSKLMLGISAQQMQALHESRMQADKEIFKERAEHLPPEIAGCVSSPTCLLAIVRVTGVAPETPADTGVLPNLRVELEIEQMLRGASEKTHIYAESRWRRIKSRYRFGHTETAFDRDEPQVGKQYVIGYLPPAYGDDGTNVNVVAAIDFSEPGHAQTFADVRHFLNIEASGDALNFAPFLKALDDPVPWIRNAAAYRLAESDSCHASPYCGEIFLAHASKLLQSSSARERFDGLQELRSIVAEAGVRKQPSSIANDTFRELLQSAVADPNFVIGDFAFEYLAEWDFLRSGEASGHCLEVVPPLRKSAIWDYAEANGKNFSTPLGDSMSCVAPTRHPTVSAL